MDASTRHDPVVIAGASGFVGRHLVARLIARGADVRCGSRDPERARAARRDARWVPFDTERADTLAPAMHGARTLVYLVHQLGRAGDLEKLESEAAERVVRAAEHAGIERIVYLGGPTPVTSRERTGEILRSGSVPAIELRASLIIGGGGERWRIARDLAMRMPVMILPRWLDRKIQPIGVDDVVEALVRAVGLHEHTDGCWDLPGPEIVSVRGLLERLAAAEELQSLFIPLPFLSPWLSSQWIRLVTRSDRATARQLVEGLTGDLVALDGGFWSYVEAAPQIELDEAIRRAVEDKPSTSRTPRCWEQVAHHVGHLPVLASRTLGS